MSPSLHSIPECPLGKMTASVCGSVAVRNAMACALFYCGPHLSYTHAHTVLNENGTLEIAGLFHVEWGGRRKKDVCNKAMKNF